MNCAPTKATIDETTPRRRCGCIVAGDLLLPPGAGVDLHRRGHLVAPPGRGGTALRRGSGLHAARRAHRIDPAPAPRPPGALRRVERRRGARTLLGNAST